MIKSVFFRVFFLFSFVMLSFTHANAMKLKVACEGDFPPYNFMKDGKLTGLDYDIVMAVLKHMGAEADVQVVPWARVVKLTDSGEVDLAFQWKMKPERKEKYNMIGPIRSGLTVFYTHSDKDIKYEKLEDLKTYTIGGIHKYSYTPEFDTADYLKKDTKSKNYDHLVKKLMKKRLDVIIGDKNSIIFTAENLKLTDKIKMVPKVLKENPRYVAFPKAKKELADKFQKALDELKANGEIATIQKKWE